MPTIGPRPLSVTFGVNEQERAENLRKNANQVLRSLNDYAPRACPERPAELEMDDAVLCAAYTKKQRGSRITKAEKDSLALLGTWRAAVRRIEAQNAGNLMLLLGVLNQFEFADRHEDATRIREFVLAHYNAPIPGPPAPRTCTDWADRWADRYSQNRGVLPLSLRQMAEVTLTTVQEPQSAAESDGEYGSF